MPTQPRNFILHNFRPTILRTGITHIDELILIKGVYRYILATLSEPQRPLLELSQLLVIANMLRFQYLWDKTKIYQRENSAKRYSSCWMSIYGLIIYCREDSVWSDGRLYLMRWDWCLEVFLSVTFCLSCWTYSACRSECSCTCSSCCSSAPILT